MLKFSTITLPRHIVPREYNTINYLHLYVFWRCYHVMFTLYFLIMNNYTIYIPFINILHPLSVILQLSKSIVYYCEPTRPIRSTNKTADSWKWQQYTTITSYLFATFVFCSQPFNMHTLLLAKKYFWKWRENSVESFFKGITS